MRATMYALVALMCFALVSADIYLQMPRGSNNRLDERNRDRDNGNRLFDSQNNNRGGYNVGQVYYYTGSIVPMEWTAQHSCGDNTRATCELIIQYTCDDKIRDGTITGTIPTNPNECYNYDCDTDVRFGRHESFDSYQNCVHRQRNKGLWTASQQLNGDAAKFTRQNPNGARRGLECPEERDYYPYWHPTIWRDIAVLTNDATRCAAYQSESQNVKSRFWCEPPAGLFEQNKKQGKQGWIPIDQRACEALSFYDKPSNQTQRGEWKEQKAWGIAPPECRENQWSRDNHHGNVPGTFGHAAGFNWTVPSEVISERCVLRLRYNISTGDIWNFENSTSVQVSNFTRSAQNPLVKNGITANRDPATVDVWSRYGLNWTDVQDSFKGTNDANQLKKSREYVMKNNPNVDIFGSLLPASKQSFIKHQLAINTAQFGRTFEDRTHYFAVRRRPSSISSDAMIYNLQVRGKRGNIVQVYPGVEYDFFPTRMEIQNGDYIHIQWTGSNTNPDNNAGQGKEGTDRHNIVPLREKTFTDGPAKVTTYPPTKGAFGTYYPGRVDDSWPFLGLSKTDLTYLALLYTPQGFGTSANTGQFGGHMDELDDAGTYFDLGPRQITTNGIYHYLCTRNNNFSNRNQAGKIVVRDSAVKAAQIGWNGGTIAGINGQNVIVKQNTFTGLQSMTLETAPRSQPNTFSGSASSDFIVLQFDAGGFNGANGQKIEVLVNYDQLPLGSYKAYRSSDVNGAQWQEVDASFSGGVARIQTDQPGTFVVESKLDAGAIAGIVVGCVVFLAFAGFVVYKLYKRKQAASSTANNVAMAGAQRA